MATANFVATENFPKINRRIDKFCKEGVWEKLGVVGRFSNGETIYKKIS